MLKKLYKKFRRLEFNLSQFMTKDPAVRVYSEFVFDLLEKNMIVFRKKYYESMYSCAQGIYLIKDGKVDFKNEIEERDCNAFLRKEFKRMEYECELQESIQKVSAAIQKTMEKIQK